MTPAALQTIAQDELRKALATRQDGRRVTYDARKADRIVHALQALHPAQSTLAKIEHAIRVLRRLLHDLPAQAARHIGRALHYAEGALKVHGATA